MQGRWAKTAVAAAGWLLLAAGAARADDAGVAPPQADAQLSDAIREMAARYQGLLDAGDATCIADLKATGVWDLNNPAVRARDPNYWLLSAGAVKARAALAECKARAHKYLGQEREELAGLVAGQPAADAVMARFDAGIGKLTPLLDRIYEADTRVVDHMGEFAVFLRTHDIRWSKAARMFAFRNKADMAAFHALDARTLVLMDEAKRAKSDLQAAAKAEGEAGS